jgi:hypothetical protein
MRPATRLRGSGRGGGRRIGGGGQAELNVIAATGTGGLRRGKEHEQDEHPK